MELKTQYNKTALAELKGHLQLRETALPILKNKETALRQEVKNLLTILRKLKNEYESSMKVLEKFEKFWQEFPSIVTVDQIQLHSKKIIGVKVPEIPEIKFSIKEISWFNHKAWIPTGIKMLKKVLRLKIKIQLAEKQQQLLYMARKKTTQKVNLYEKVQIPLLENEILKIKRFLEDEENISKAAQKIVKNRNVMSGVMT
jgi:V/A-type H+-transporting ATPase subunit D